MRQALDLNLNATCSFFLKNSWIEAWVAQSFLIWALVGFFSIKIKWSLWKQILLSKWQNMHEMPQNEEKPIHYISEKHTMLPLYFCSRVLCIYTKPSGYIIQNTTHGYCELDLKQLYSHSQKLNTVKCPAIIVRHKIWYNITLFYCRVIKTINCMMWLHFKNIMLNELSYRGELLYYLFVQQESHTKIRWKQLNFQGNIKNIGYLRYWWSSV